MKFLSALGIVASLVISISTAAYVFFSKREVTIVPAQSLPKVSSPQLGDQPQIQPSNEEKEPTAESYQYNSMGQLILICYSDGTKYFYQYDRFGNKIGETDRKGGHWHYAYDDQGHPVSMIDPQGRTAPGNSSH